MIKKLMCFIVVLLIPFIILALPKGDVNGDGKVTVADFTLIRRYMLGYKITSNEEKRADVNGDKKINAKDFNLIRKIMVDGTKEEIDDKPVDSTSATSICESVKNNSSIDYKPFLSLSKNDDDYKAIKAAHDCANKYNKPVVVTKGTYHIYKKNNETISVQTDTNLGDSTIYIHDNFSTLMDYKEASIYTIENPKTGSDKCDDKKKITNFNNDIKSLAPSTGKYYIKISEKNGTKVYDRNKGGNETVQAHVKRDVVRIYNGVVQDPMFWDYKNSTIEVERCPIPSHQLVFKNGNFRTVILNKCKNDCTEQTARGILVNRSNTKLYDIKHVYVDSNDKYVHKVTYPYSGLFRINSTADVVMEKCVVYSLRRIIESGDNSSTYDLTVGHAANVRIDNVTMSKADKSYNHLSGGGWGVMGGTEFKNLTVVNSELNRIDAHRNSYNITVKDSVIGIRGIRLTGTGERKDNRIVIENVTWKYTSDLIDLRPDYGTTWNGTITIKNSKVENVPESTLSVIEISDLSSNTKKGLVFNQPIYNPTKVTIDGLKVNSSNVKKIKIFDENKTDFDNYYFKHFQRKKNQNEATVISKKNITGYGSSNVVNYSK